MARELLGKQVALFLVLALVLGCVGCKPAPVVESTVKVTDQLGREVEVPKDVQRIVSGYYISTYMLMALGASDRLVGIEMKADTRPLYRLAAPRLLEIPGVGTAKAINVEAVMDLAPDLVVLPVWLEDTVENLEELGLTVIVVQPEDLESLAEAFTILGTAIGSVKLASEMVEYYQDKVEMVRELAAELDSRPRVYLAGSEPLRTCTQDMYQHDTITLAGGENVSADLGVGYWANVSLEQVLAWDPEVILLADYNEAMTEEISQDARWQGVSAVRNGRVHRFPSPIEPWDSPGPSAVLGVLWLTHTLHPDKYSRDDMEAEVQYFYQHFYDLDVSLEDLGL